MANTHLFKEKSALFTNRFFRGERKRSGFDVEHALFGKKTQRNNFWGGGGKGGGLIATRFPPHPANPSRDKLRIWGGGNCFAEQINRTPQTTRHLFVFHTIFPPILHQKVYKPSTTPESMKSRGPAGERNQIYQLHRVFDPRKPSTANRRFSPLVLRFGNLPSGPALAGDVEV